MFVGAGTSASAAASPHIHRGQPVVTHCVPSSSSPSVSFSLKAELIGKAKEAVVRETAAELARRAAVAPWRPPALIDSRPKEDVSS